MTVSEDAPGTAVAPTQPRRAGRELLLDYVFRPLSNLLVPVLLRAGVAPTVVVLANAVAGLGAALALVSGELLAAALLLQLKTVLDNTDGQLARAAGRVTLVGRYLDTEADLVVNAALFAALAYVTSQPLLAAASFVALTLVLTVDFNVTELYRERHGSTQELRRTGSGTERVLERIYGAVFAPLDRIVRRLSERRFSRLTGPGDSAEHVYDAQLAYIDGFTVTVLANLGLTTQLAVLGVCLVLGVPAVYLWLALAGLLALVPLQIRAEHRARSVLRGRLG